MARRQCRCRWIQPEVGAGQHHSQIDINGTTTTGGNTLQGGMLALRATWPAQPDQFSVIPELGVTLGYDLTSRLRATAGYTFMYWSNVSRPATRSIWT